MTEKITMSPCTCGGSIIWQKENIVFNKEHFKKVEVGICNECRMKYLSDDTAEMLVEKFKKH